MEMDTRTGLVSFCETGSRLGKKGMYSVRHCQQAYAVISETGDGSGSTSQSQIDLFVHSFLFFFLPLLSPPLSVPKPRDSSMLGCQ